MPDLLLVDATITAPLDMDGLSPSPSRAC